MTENIATVDDLTARAADIAANNPPSRVLATVVLGIFTIVGFILGRLWLYTAGALVYVWLSFQYGMKKGAKTAKPKAQSQTPGF
jgi:hypothetical protein